MRWTQYLVLGVPPGVPGPGGAQDAVEIGDLRRPAQHLAGAAGVGDERSGIARPAPDLAARDLVAGDALGGLDHRLDAVPRAGAEIELEALAAVQQMADRADMRLGQVLDMDVVAHG